MIKKILVYPTNNARNTQRILRLRRQLRRWTNVNHMIISILIRVTLIPVMGLALQRGISPGVPSPVQVGGYCLSQATIWHPSHIICTRPLPVVNNPYIPLHSWKVVMPHIILTPWDPILRSDATQTHTLFVLPLVQEPGLSYALNRRLYEWRLILLCLLLTLQRAMDLCSLPFTHLGLTFQNGAGRTLTEV